MLVMAMAVVSAPAKLEWLLEGWKDVLWLGMGHVHGTMGFDADIVVCEIEAITSLMADLEHFAEHVMFFVLGIGKLLAPLIYGSYGSFSMCLTAPKAPRTEGENNTVQRR